MPELEERENQLSIKIVFLDSNCLVKRSDRAPDFQNLLRLAQERKVKLITSRIVAEEWVSNIRDEHIAACARLRARHKDEASNLRNNPLFTETDVAKFAQNIPNPAETWGDADRRAQEYVQNFLDKHDIEVIEPGADHAGRVFRKYCGWEAPFPHNQNYTQIDDQDFRDKRKLNFPDGFIIETIIDYALQIEQFYVLSADTGLRDALPKNIQRNTYPLNKIIDVLEPPAPPPAPTTPEPTPPTPPVTPTAPCTSKPTPQTETPPVQQVTPPTSEIEKLPDRILGYLLWLSGGASGVPKEVLSKHLLKKGYTDDQINEMAANFVASGALKDSGNHYIVMDKQLARAAANGVRTEILELLRD